MMLIRAAGKISSWGWLSIVLTPSLHIEPQEGLGGTTPIPMKDKNASVKIAAGTAKVKVTNMTPMVLGMMWRTIR